MKETKINLLQNSQEVDNLKIWNDSYKQPLEEYNEKGYIENKGTSLKPHKCKEIHTSNITINNDKKALFEMIEKNLRKTFEVFIPQNETILYIENYYFGDDTSNYYDISIQKDEIEFPKPDIQANITIDSLNIDYVLEIIRITLNSNPTIHLNKENNVFLFKIQFKKEEV